MGAQGQQQLARSPAERGVEQSETEVPALAAGDPQNQRGEGGDRPGTHLPGEGLAQQLTGPFAHGSGPVGGTHDEQGQQCGVLRDPASARSRIRPSGWHNARASHDSSGSSRASASGSGAGRYHADARTPSSSEIQALPLGSAMSSTSPRAAPGPGAPPPSPRR
ncbi:hypothetical protein ACR6C2_13240 [Streptomyces sp. INA 01156]